MQILRDAQLQTKLATAIDANDARAIDIKYHKNCYFNKVTNVLLQPQCKSSEDSAVVAAGVEFLDISEKAFREGKPLNMADLEALYIDVLCKKMMWQFLHVVERY